METKHNLFNNLDKIIEAFPVAWIEKYLPDPNNKDSKIKLRKFQEEFVRVIFERKHRWVSYCLGRQSGKTIALIAAALYRAIVMHRKVVIVAPQEGNLLTIWEKLTYIIDNSEYISSLVTRSIGKPYKIKAFKGGGVIKGVITGTNAEKPSVSSRGISGDDIFVDEAAYVPESAWQIILPFIINTKDGVLVLTSTPSDNDGFFAQSFEDKSLNFYTRSISTPEANENWSEDMEKLMRAQFPGAMYDREILAIFPKVAGGVFPESSIFSSMADYKYSDIPLPGYHYVMGVDWNTSENGCQIALIAFNQNEYILSYRTVIDNVQNPQLQAVQEIIRLNNIFKPEFIFADSGYGHTQIELLHDHGLKHPETGLAYKVKAIDFNSDDTVKVIVNGEQIKKKPKAFMVALMQGLMQNGQFKFSKYDNEGDHSLFGQFRKFKVKRQGFGMVPVFTDGYFHGIIAVMIGILGIFKYYSQYSADFSNPNNIFVSFDTEKTFSINNIPERNIENRIPTPDEIRNADPKYKEFIGEKQYIPYNRSRISALGDVKIQHRGRGGSRRNI